MRFSLGAIAFVFCSMIHSSLAEFPFDGDFLSPEPYPGDSNLYLDSDWQVPEDSTLVFNDVLYPADSDLDFLAASTCGNGNGNLNKLRARDETFCFNGGQRKKEGAIVPQVIQPGEKLFDQLDQLGSTTKSGSEKCVFPPYLTNLCCNGFLGDIYLLGPPSVWTSIDDCYSSFANVPCPTQYDVCCQGFSTKLAEGYLCIVLGFTIDGNYYPIDGFADLPPSLSLPPGAPMRPADPPPPPSLPGAL